MSWSPLAPLSRSGAPRNVPITVALMVGGKQRRPALVVMLRPTLLAGIDWLAAGRGVEVLFGGGEHAGMLRIQPGGAHLIGRVGLSRADAPSLQLRLLLPPGIAPAAHPGQPVVFDAAPDRIELRLPAWGQPPAPEPRGVALAREAAAAARARAGL